MLYANGTPDVVGPFDTKAVRVKWGTGTNATSANYFAAGAYQNVNDPQCATVTTAQNLNTFCTLQAITDRRTNQIVLQNPLPGRRGTLAQRAVQLPGTWRFDANMQKAFKMTESKSLEFRIDSSDVLNHAEPGTPNLNINSTTAQLGVISRATAKST